MRARGGARDRKLCCAAGATVDHGRLAREGEDATREEWFWGSNLRSLVWFGAWIFI